MCVCGGRMRGKTQEQDAVFCISLWRVDGKEPVLGALLPWTVPTPLLHWKWAKNNSFVWKHQCQHNHRSPPRTHTFCRIPSLYILLFKAPQRMCVSIPSETGIVPHDSQNTSERERERERKTGPTLQPVTLGVIHTAHIWCTMAERPLPPKPF